MGPRQLARESLRAFVLLWRKPGGSRLIVGLAVVAAVALGIVLARGAFTGSHQNSEEMSSRSKRVSRVLQLTDAQLAGLEIQPVERHSFHSELVTEGRIAIDEDHSTPIFSPYAGRVMKLFVNPAIPSLWVGRCSRSKPPTWCRRRTISSPLRPV
jgi:hypothetical protein